MMTSDINNLIEEGAHDKLKSLIETKQIRDFKSLKKILQTFEENHLFDYLRETAEIGIEIAEQFETPLDLMKIEYIRTKADLYLNNYDQALKDGKALLNQLKQLDQADEVDFQRMKAKILHLLANTYIRKGKLQEAQNLLKTCSETLEGIDEKTLHSKVYYSLGYLAVRQEHNEEGIEYFKQALQAEPENPRVQLQCNQGIGNALFEINKVEKAIEYYEKALQIARQMGVKNSIATTYSNLGGAYMLLYKYDLALDYMKKSIEIYEELEDIRSLKILYHNLSKFYTNRGDLSGAEEYSKQALEISEDLGAVRDQALEKMNIAGIYYSHGRYTDAEKLCNESMEIAKKHEFKSIIAKNYILKLQINAKQNRQEQLRKYFAELNEFYNQYGDEYDSVRSQFKFGKAIYLTNQKRGYELFQAQQLYKQLIDDEYYGTIPRISILKKLVEIQIQEYQLLENEEIAKEFEQYLTTITNLSEENGLVYHLCEATLLRSRLKLVRLQIDDALDELRNAREIAEQHNMQELLDKIKVFEDEIYEDIEQWKQITTNTTNTFERMKMAKVDQYLDQVLEVYTSTE